MPACQRLPQLKLTAPVETQVVGVLQAAADMRREGNTEESWNAFDRAFDPVLDQQNTTTDEALAVLLSFYIGEHAYEDLRCELVARGERELNFLTRYRDNRVDVPAPAQPFDSREKRPAYDGVIAEIRAHASCRREH
jgi:hypothetical protein